MVLKIILSQQIVTVNVCNQLNLILCLCGIIFQANALNPNGKNMFRYSVKECTLFYACKVNEFYISVSVHHKSIIYNKPTRCNSGGIVFIKNYKYALHISDALCVHLQEHYKL